MLNVTKPEGKKKMNQVIVEKSLIKLNLSLNTETSHHTNQLLVIAEKPYTCVLCQHVNAHLIC